MNNKYPYFVAMDYGSQVRELQRKYILCIFEVLKKKSQAQLMVSRTYFHILRGQSKYEGLLDT